MADMLYHEKQVAALCGVHCLNTLLQGPFFTEWDLAEIAHQLDALEKQFMAEGGVHTADFQKFMAEESGNVSSNGMFSSQVLSKALESWNLGVVPLEHPDMRAAAAAPSQQPAYICHLEAHWFTIRPVAGAWWNFNSLFPAPQPLSLTYLDAFLNTLKREGWTIFVVQGALPPGGGHAVDLSSGNGRYWTPADARQANAKAEEVQQAGRGRKVWEDVVNMAAQPGGRTLRLRDARADTAVELDEDAQLQQAFQASLQDVSGARFTDGADADDDAALAAAIAASLGDGDWETSAKRHCNASNGSHEAGPSGAGAQAGPSTGARAAGALAGDGSVAAVVLEEPDAGAGVCELSVRLPRSGQCQRRFHVSAQVKDVWTWLGAEGWDMRAHQLCMPCPRTVLRDGEASLEQVGVSRRERLILEPL